MWPVFTSRLELRVFTSFRSMPPDLRREGLDWRTQGSVLSIACPEIGGTCTSLCQTNTFTTYYMCFSDKHILYLHTCAQMQEGVYTLNTRSLFLFLNPMAHKWLFHSILISFDRLMVLLPTFHVIYMYICKYKFIKLTLDILRWPYM